jgi:hypothetical protein
MASEPMPVNDLPVEIKLKILSYFGPDDFCLIIAKVCEKWNVLAKDKVLWKTLSYTCDSSSHISRIAEVRCTALLGFRTNSSFHPELRQEISIMLTLYMVVYLCIERKRDKTATRRSPVTCKE